ncbi:MAG: mechanosensitive ion channel family protein [Rickettsiales bacterium]
MADFWNELVLIINKNSEWLVQICLVLSATLLASIILQRIIHRIYGTISGDNPASWRYVIISSLSLPVRVFVWVGGITLSLSVLYEQFHIAIIKSLLGFQPAIHTAVVAWFLVRFSSRYFNFAAIKYENVSNSAALTMEKVAKTVILIAMILLILPSLGISINGLLTFGGIGGIVVGLAAKDMIANLFGAIMIHFDRPFAIGDWVAIPEKDVEGTVENIGWRQVVIRRFDKRPVFVPNSMFGNMVVINPSRMTHRRFNEIIGIRYDDIKLVSQIVNDIKDYLLNHQQIDKKAALLVNLDKFSAYSVDIFVYALSRNTDWAGFLDIKQEILLKISDIISAHGAEIAFPTQLVQLSSNADIIPNN